MTEQKHSTDEQVPVREVYDEFAVGTETVAMISDPLNERAWIHSTAPTPVEP